MRKTCSKTEYRGFAKLPQRLNKGKIAKKFDLEICWELGESENIKMWGFRWGFWKNKKKIEKIIFYIIFDENRDFFNFS